MPNPRVDPIEAGLFGFAGGMRGDPGAGSRYIQGQRAQQQSVTDEHARIAGQRATMNFIAALGEGGNVFDALASIDGPDAEHVDMSVVIDVALEHLKRQGMRIDKEAEAAAKAAAEEAKADHAQRLKLADPKEQAQAASAQSLADERNLKLEGREQYRNLLEQVGSGMGLTRGRSVEDLTPLFEGGFGLDIPDTPETPEQRTQRIRAEAEAKRPSLQRLEQERAAKTTPIDEVEDRSYRSALGSARGKAEGTPPETEKTVGSKNVDKIFNDIMHALDIDTSQDARASDISEEKRRETVAFLNTLTDLSQEEKNALVRKLVFRGILKPKVK